MFILCSLFAVLGGPAVQWYLPEPVVVGKTAVKFDAACLAHLWVMKCERTVARGLQPPDGRMFPDEGVQALIGPGVGTPGPSWDEANGARCGDAQAHRLVGVVELQV